METTDIHESFAEIVASSLGIESSTVKPDSTLEQLGAASLDVVEISMETESKFNIWLPDKNVLDTAIEVVGRPRILDGDNVTELAKQMFRARLPREEWSLLEGEVTAADLQRHFMRVGTWVRMIAELREQTPAACSECGGPELTDRPGFLLACASCGHEMKLRPGQEINREWIEQFMSEASRSDEPDEAVMAARSQSAAG